MREKIRKAGLPIRIWPEGNGLVLCARSDGLVTRVCAMTFAVVARLIYQTLLARMSAGQ